MTEEDYMKLTKERLAGLLAERDLNTFNPLIVGGNEHLSCFEDELYTNLFHDCVNYLRQTTGDRESTFTQLLK